MTMRGKMPYSAQVLERWAMDYAREHGLVRKRVQDWISYMILASKIEKAVGPDASLFVIKGGVALEMRLGRRARATRDLDLIARVVGAEGPAEALRVALGGSYQDFTFRVKDDPYHMEDGSVRVEVVLEYRDRGWGTVQVDLTPEEDHALEREDLAPFDLGFFGLEPAEGLPCLSLRYHIAHKIHGMTRPSTEEWNNDRVHDLIDVFLLKELAADLEMRDLRAACVEVFKAREKHEWPPIFLPPASWEPEFEAMAERVGIPVKDFETAVRAARDYIAEVDGSA
ncbi:MAG: nucleotidyl transferase AbiEii/AbiGii toxin family protein [Gemmatimonadota bacterium]|nr:nucleotidyl transferase AbiEii/AbiGii toxin family protein [Gemmatimonadota bacterium]